MAKVQTLDWAAWREGKVQPKGYNQVKQEHSSIKWVATATMVVAGIAVAHIFPAFLASASATAGVKAVAVMAADPSFQVQLSAATKPIKDLIFGFAHEIYFVFMCWGALEALIGKPQQGFTRMKVSTGAYVLLFWVPWIVDQVNKVRPAMGW